MNARDSRSTARGFGFLYLVSAHNRGEPEVTGDHATEWPNEVPIVAADMGDVLSRGDGQETLESLRYVMVKSNSRGEVQAELDYIDSLRGLAPTTHVSGQGYVRVVLAPHHELWDGHEGWLRFQLAPADALALAGELTRAAAHAVE